MLPVPDEIGKLGEISNVPVVLSKIVSNSEIVSKFALLKDILLFLEKIKSK